MSLLTETVDLPTADGAPMRAYVARPAGQGPFPGVIVGAEIYGITGHVRGVCERLAGIGYVASGGAASLVLAQVSVEGSYFGDIFVGLLLFGTGVGATFVAAQIAGLSGVAEQESGLAAGLVDSSFNVGSALGIAVLSTVAVAHTENLLAGPDPPDSAARALTEGFQWAFLVAFGIALLGALLALLLLRRETEDAAAPARGQVTPCPPNCASPVAALKVERGE